MSSNRKKLIRIGVPFFVLVIGGSFAMTGFSKIRYQYRSQKLISPEVYKNMGIEKKDPDEVTIEKEFEKMQSLDIDSWVNKRGPRPWEPDNETMNEIRERQRERSRPVEKI